MTRCVCAIIAWLAFFFSLSLLAGGAHDAISLLLLKAGGWVVVEIASRRRLDRKGVMYVQRAPHERGSNPLWFWGSLSLPIGRFETPPTDDVSRPHDDNNNNNNRPST